MYGRPNGTIWPGWCRLPRMVSFAHRRGVPVSATRLAEEPAESAGAGGACGDGAVVDDDCGGAGDRGEELPFVDQSADLPPPLADTAPARLAR
eukprot:3831574-Alexandrium_andersonii.AAC.1